jgi:hypothetical protein
LIKKVYLPYTNKINMETNATKTVFLSLMMCFAFFAKAQLNYQPGGFNTFVSSYTDIELTGTPVTMTNNDSGYSVTPLPIGFPFSFNGITYDSLIMYVDGFLKLGTQGVSNPNALLFSAWTQPPQGGPFNNASSAGYNPTAGPQDTSLIVPFGGDYFGASGGIGTPKFTISTTGSPGSQVCTIQWKDLSEKDVTLLVQTAVATVLRQFDTINFQVKLYESTNVIEFVYGKFVSSINGSNARFAACGLKGNNNAGPAQLLTMTKGSVANWGIAAPNSQTLGVPAGNYNTTTSNALNYGNNVGVARALPEEGRTYQFGPVVFNDLAISTVYAQGKIALPCYAADSIKVYITNPGINPQSGVTVTLDITGANTHSATTTIPFIAGGGTITVAFPPFTPTVLGNNLITVSLPFDDNNGNNEGHYGFTVTDRYLSYIDSLQPVGQSQGSTVTMNFWGSKYTVTGTRMVTQVTAYILANSNAEGDTVAGFVIDENGKILGRSEHRIVQPSDLGTYMTFDITLPPVITNGSFIAGICGGQIVNPTVAPFNYYLGAYQLETPGRANAYYSIQGTSTGIWLTNAVPGDNFYAFPQTVPQFTIGRLMIECTVDPLPDNDVGVTGAGPLSSIKIPTNLSVPLKATVRNNGLLSQAAGLNVSYSVNGGPVVGPVTTSAGISSLDSVSVEFTGPNALLFSTPGTYKVKIFTSMPGDAITGNDTFVVTYTAQPALTLPYTINNNIMGNWSAVHSGTVLWKQQSAVQANGIVNGNVLYADYKSTVDAESHLLSPTFNLTGTVNPVLHFHVALAPDTLTFTEDSLEVMVSTDGGFTFTPVYTRSSDLSTPLLGTRNGTPNNFVPSTAQDWRYETVNLSAYAGEPFVIIAFRGHSGSGNNVFIGNVSITDPVSLSVQPVSSTSTYISGNAYVSYNSIGDPMGELSIARYNIAPPTTASPVFATNTTEMTNNGAIFTPSNVSTTEWYTITYSGIGTNHEAASAPYSLSFDISSLVGVSYADSLYIMRRANATDSWKAITSTISGSLISTPSISGFSDFAIGSVPGANALPVEWLNVHGKRISSNENLLSWNTASEKDNGYFEVERSADQKQYRAVGRVKGAGNSSYARSYSFNDKLEQPASADMYYRIRQIDVNGKSSYSKVVTIRPAFSADKDVIIPNPFENSAVAYVSNTSNASVLHITVTDITGKVVIQRSVRLSEGNNEIGIDEFSALKGGLYFTQVQIDDQQPDTRKLLKVK